MYVSPVSNSCRIAIVFRGPVKHISADEKSAYHPSVDVYWQQYMWVDRESGSSMGQPP